MRGSEVWGVRCEDEWGTLLTLHCLVGVRLVSLSPLCCLESLSLVRADSERREERVRAQVFNLQAFINYCQRRPGSLASVRTEGRLAGLQKGLVRGQMERWELSTLELAVTGLIKLNFPPPLLLALPGNSSECVAPPALTIQLFLIISDTEEGQVISGNVMQSQSQDHFTLTRPRLDESGRRKRKMGKKKGNLSTR